MTLGPPRYVFPAYENVAADASREDTRRIDVCREQDANGGIRSCGQVRCGGGVPKSGSSPPVARAERRVPNANADATDRPARVRQMKLRRRITEVEAAPKV